MIKGILICCGFLIMQLVLLHHVDHRQTNSRTQVEYTQTNTPQANLRNREGQLTRREDEDSDDSTV
ncbi:hypothetical protein ACUN8C_06955 [Kushneria sp. Sum13]|uniref:hypothetical protein n=1 Tax=Kushneria sp. Sum13 TaxID=3459196 RepID=UPI0040464379